ncbi:hypothetical protein ACLOJK_020719 [Asimina triloba]
MNFSRLLRALGDSKCIPKGKAVHGQMIVSGFAPDLITNNNLLSMYVKCELLNEAQHTFAQMSERNLVSWTVLLWGYVNMSFAEDAMECFRSMLDDGIDPNHFTYVGVLAASVGLRAIRTGKELHGRIYRVGLESNGHIRNSLVTLYTRCGLIGSAQTVFDGIPCPSLYSWTSVLSGYYQRGENEEVLRIFRQLQRTDVKVNEFTVATALGACAGLADLMIGRQIHGLVIKQGIRLDVFIATGIVNVYAKCGELGNAFCFVSEIDKPGLASWTALLGGCAQYGEAEKAINIFHMLHSSGFELTEHTISSILAACANAFAINEGKQIHSLILKLGFKLVTFVGNSMIDLYAKCGLLEESSKVFHEMPEQDIVSWNALFAGYVQQSRFGEAIGLLNQMILEGINRSIYTYSSILSLCGDLPAPDWGKQVHCCIIKPGFDAEVVVGGALIDMYSKCGRLSEARKLFNNLNSKTLVSWNTLMMGYAQHGLGREALQLFDKLQRDGVKPNEITFLGVLTACSHVGLVEDGHRYFDSMIRDHGITPRIDHFACMVDLFARVGHVRRAYDFISSMPIVPGCVTHKNVDLGRLAAESILKIDAEDVPTYVMLSSLYADAEMWDEMVKVRNVMKEKGLKKDPACSWIELKNRRRVQGLSFVVEKREKGETKRRREGERREKEREREGEEEKRRGGERRSK